MLQHVGQRFYFLMWIQTSLELSQYQFVGKSHQDINIGCLNVWGKFPISDLEPITFWMMPQRENGPDGLMLNILLCESLIIYKIERTQGMNTIRSPTFRTTSNENFSENSHDYGVRYHRGHACQASCVRSLRSAVFNVGWRGTTLQSYS